MGCIVWSAKATTRTTLGRCAHDAREPIRVALPTGDGPWRFHRVEHRRGVRRRFGLDGVTLTSDHEANYGFSVRQGIVPESADDVCFVCLVQRRSHK